jgi:hypothetical protein
MINNFEQIKSLLKFTSDTFYFLQIIQRKKEVAGISSSNRVIKTYYIDSIEHLDRRKEEIIDLCNYFTARAYININPRSWKIACLQSVRHLAGLVISEQHKGVKTFLNSVCGQYSSNEFKSWVVDLDDKNLLVLEATKGDINLRKSAYPDNIIDVIETKNGYHIITHPFDTSNWKGPEIHKNNPTILYIP